MNNKKEFVFEPDEEYLIDPPQGWLYGFPKRYSPSKDGDVLEWLVREGCPAENLHHYRIIFKSEKSH